MPERFGSVPRLPTQVRSKGSARGGWDLHELVIQLGHQYH